MLILGIETSCDETAAAIVEDGRRIVGNTVASQIEIHARYGGIVPEVASRQHVLAIIPTVREALRRAKADIKEIKAIAVTYGPGLAGSLIVGVNMAKAIALSYGLPLIGINHLEAHIYANWLATDREPLLPTLCLIVSGGHTDLVLMRDHGSYQKLGQTRDDAAGEAFDKAARILGLGYPGGPAIEKAAKDGSPSIPLPSAKLKDNADFSFSGLKTALLHLTQSKKPGQIFSTLSAAASFQEAVVWALTTRTNELAQELDVRSILLGGGVAANQALRERFLNTSSIPVMIPPLSLCTDNAAMVASCGYFRYMAGNRTDLNLDVCPGLSF